MKVIFLELKDQFKCLVGGYFGIRDIDEYELKVYLLKEIEEYIKDFIEVNPINDYDYLKESLKIEKELSEITKLQDALIVLYKINAPVEVVLLVKKKLKKLMDSRRA